MTRAQIFTAFWATLFAAGLIWSVVADGLVETIVLVILVGILLLIIKILDRIGLWLANRFGR